MTGDALCINSNLGAQVSTLMICRVFWCVKCFNTWLDWFALEIVKNVVTEIAGRCLSDILTPALWHCFDSV